MYHLLNICLLTGILYFFCHRPPIFPLHIPPPHTSDNHKSDLFFYQFFKRVFIWRFCISSGVIILNFVCHKCLIVFISIPRDVKNPYLSSLLLQIKPGLHITIGISFYILRSPSLFMFLAWQKETLINFL